MRLVSLTSRIRAVVRLLWREVAKFGTVGGIAFIIDSGIYLWLLSGPMADSAGKAKVIAGLVATVFSWLANRYWTFRHRRQANPVREAVLFVPGKSLKNTQAFLIKTLTRLRKNPATRLIRGANSASQNVPKRSPNWRIYSNKTLKNSPLS